MGLYLFFELECFSISCCRNFYSFHKYSLILGKKPGEINKKKPVRNGGN